MDGTKVTISNDYNALLSYEECCKIIKRQLRTAKFDVIKNKIDRIKEDKMGFLGDHLKLCISVHVHSSTGAPSRRVDLRYFLKIVPENDTKLADFIIGIQAFEKEAMFYSSLLNDLKELQMKDKLPSESHYKHFHTGKANSYSWTCECYLSKANIIVLEDLSLYGFRTCDPRYPMDYEHCVLVLQTLARFHSSSFILEEKLRNTNDTDSIHKLYQDMFFETLWSPDSQHPGNKLLASSIKGAQNLLKFLPKYGQSSEYFDIIHEKIPETLKKINKLVLPSEMYRNIVCHGDLSTNNILFRYGRGSKTPVEARFVDFQLLRYNPPAHDVMCFLHLVVTRKVREANLDNFLNIYYQNLSIELYKHNLFAEKILAWSEFRKSCTCYASVGRLTAVLYFQQILLKDESKKAILAEPQHTKMFMTTDKSKYVIENYLSDPIYRVRNTEALEEMIECCILNK